METLTASWHKKRKSKTFDWKCKKMAWLVNILFWILSHNHNQNKIKGKKWGKKTTRLFPLRLNTEHALESFCPLYLLGRREGSCSSSAASGCHCYWPPAPSEMDHPLACHQSSVKTMIWSWRTLQSELRWNETVEEQRQCNELKCVQKTFWSGYRDGRSQLWMSIA